MGRPALNLEGQIINGIKILRQYEDNEHKAGKAIRWVCECPECHEEYLVRASRLKNGETTMCKKCSSARATPPHNPPKYYVGAKFGCWTIVAASPFCNRWHVQCECGKQFCPNIMDIQKAPDSCNCSIKSKGERKIYSWLNDRNILFEMQKTFPDCKPKNRVLMFDFFLPTYNIIIEFDGKQHFEPNEYFGGEEQLQQTKQYDEYKNEWAKNHDIKMIRIAYHEDIEERLNEEIVKLTETEP